MERSTVIDTLRQHEQELHDKGVVHLFLFGSVARDEAKASSDIDLFFDFDNPRFSLIELADTKQFLESVLRVPADVMTRSSLHPGLKQKIEDSAIQVF